MGSIPGLGRYPEEGHGNHSSILAWRIPMDRGAQRATVHGITKSQTRCCCCYVASVVSNSVRPIDGSPPGSTIPGIFQARTLEWVVISFSNARKWKGKVKSLSRVRLFVTPLTAAYQAPPSMGFSRQEYWSGVPLPSPESDTTEWLNTAQHSIAPTGEGSTAT